MILKLNPRVSGKFVEQALKGDHVQDVIERIDLSEEQFKHMHDLAKSIIITAFNKLDVDVNKIINDLKD